MVKVDSCLYDHLYLLILASFIERKPLQSLFGLEIMKTIYEVPNLLRLEYRIEHVIFFFWMIDLIS